MLNEMSVSVNDYVDKKTKPVQMSPIKECGSEQRSEFVKTPPQMNNSLG